ncbi:MAG: hypothetical protein ACE5SW_12265 [Nitrososphaeraceae archaeon]
MSYDNKTNSNSKPTIVALQNGQLYLINSREKKIVENLEDSNGKKLSHTGNSVM